MLADAIDSAFQIPTSPFRRAMIKSLVLTAAVLALAGFAVDRLAVYLIPVGPHWLGVALSIMIAAGVIVGMIFLAAPTASLVASFYLDDIAAIVEREVDPDGAPGRPAPALKAAAAGLRFAALSIVVNALALALLFVPGVGVAAFFVANGYLLGREYFELAAMRFRAPDEARSFRRRHAVLVFIGGVIIAVFVAVPIVNLFTPLFATAFMTRLHKRLSFRSP